MFYAVDIALALFLFFLFIQFLLGATSFWSGVRFRRYVNFRLAMESAGFDGLVTLIVPCRGKEAGLSKNLNAIMSQNYKQREVLFVVEKADDEAMPVISKIVENYPESKIILAGAAVDSGQKVHNLVKGIHAADPESKAFVFADSDIRPVPDWLNSLLAPLLEPSVVCSSGYRWFEPINGGFASQLRGAWNASITSALGETQLSNFCWGGSTAITRKHFEELDILNRWKGTVSDDFVLTNELREDGLGVHFEPKCLTPTVGDCTISELLEFTNRQMKITRVYSRRHFVTSFAGAALFSLTFFPALLILPFVDGNWFAAILWFTGMIWLFGTLKCILRLSAVANCPGIRRSLIRRQYLAQIVLWPFSSILFLINDIAALFSRRLTWRGITYELVSGKVKRIIR